MTESPVKILLVDDHRILRQGLRALVSEQPGFKIAGEASNGQQALELVRNLSPDVVVMDVHLSNENGIDVSRRILAEFPNVRIVVLSSEPHPEKVTEALQAGVSGYVLKEGDLEELVRAIHAVLHHRVYLCPSVAAGVVAGYLQSLSQTATPAKPSLTERERRLLTLVAQGQRSKEIAAALNVGVKSVETYRSRLMRKLNCASANELTRYAIREGIVSA